MINWCGVGVPPSHRRRGRRRHTTDGGDAAGTPPTAGTPSLRLGGHDGFRQLMAVSADEFGITRELLHGRHEFFWNWNVDLGGTMAGDFSFYLWGSPFFWITTLFPENAIPYLMPFLMALKYGCCACCAYLYIKRYVKKYTYAMIGGYLYAFSGFNACNV